MDPLPRLHSRGSGHCFLCAKRSVYAPCRSMTEMDSDWKRYIIGKQTKCAGHFWCRTEVFEVAQHGGNTPPTFDSSQDGWNIQCHPSVFFTKRSVICDDLAFPSRPYCAFEGSLFRFQWWVRILRTVLSQVTTTNYDHKLRLRITTTNYDYENFRVMHEVDGTRGLHENPCKGL